MQLTGIHHVTAVSAAIRNNLQFYTQVMGMRLVKRSVNQDDVTAYHLFYADGAGSPGTDLTFFDWPMPSERRGSHSIVRTGLRVKGRDTLEWWRSRLTAEDLSVAEIVERDGRATLDFEDPEGQRLSLVDDGGLGDEPVRWSGSRVPEEHQIRGLGPVTISAQSLEPTAAFLEQVMNLRRAREYDNVVVFEMAGAPGPHAELHVEVQPELAPGRLGAGGVHHMAFRTPNEEEYHAWKRRLDELRIANSGEIDRFYFRSLYFREPNGVLFEIATDGPGFAVDEDPATLGDHLALPPFLEPRRAAIEAGLKPL